MKTNNLFYLLTTTALLLCCNCVSCKKRCKSIPSPTMNVFNLQVDDSVKHLFSDSISKIIFEADTINLFSLSVKPLMDSLKTTSTPNDSIILPNFHDCYILHDYGALSKAEVCPLLHVLSDRDNYLPDRVRLKSPFIPDVALSFKKDTISVDIIFSFTGGQMYVFMKNGNMLYFKYTYERLIMKFFQNYLKDQRITEYLNL